MATASNTQKHFFRRYGNEITVALWALALASHLILIPKFIRDMRKK